MKTWTTLGIQKGSSETITVDDASKWYLVEETYTGRQFISARIVSKHDTKSQALKAWKNAK